MREVRERCEIAGCPNRALRGNYRMNAGIEHGAKSFNGCGLHSAKTFGECVRAQQYNRASFRCAERFADSASVRTNQIYLQLPDLFGGNAHAGKFAKAGVDAVSRFA